MATKGQKDTNKPTGWKNNDTHIPAIGIDLGTTYCCVAVFRNNKRAEIIQSEVGKNKTPSYIAYPGDPDENESDEEDADQDDDIMCGETAKDLAHENVKGTIYDVKRMFGRQFHDPRLQRDMGFWPFDVIEEMGEVKIRTREDSAHTPVQIAAELLKHLKTQANKYLNADVSNAVVTVPVYFNAKQRSQTTQACTLAGLNVLQLVNEPIAAAVAYNFHRKGSANSTTSCLIFDFGGGTLDIAVLTISSNKFYVKAVGGDDHLGGQDIDNNLVEYCLEQFKNKYKVDIKAERSSSDAKISVKASNSIRRLKTECEKQKQFLSQINAITISINAMHGDKDLVVIISREVFNSINAEVFEKCIRLLETVVKKSGIDRKDIDEIVMAGGSSRIPRIQEMISEYFGGKKLCCSVDADEAVAVGASMLAFQGDDVEIPNVIFQEEENTEESSNQNLLYKCLNAFTEAMKSKLDASTSVLEDLGGAYLYAKEIALVMFEKSNKTGSKMEVAELQNDLSEQIRSEYKNISEKLNLMLHDCEKRYRDIMSTQTSSKEFSIQNFEYLHTEAKREAVRSYRVDDDEAQKMNLNKHLQAKLDDVGASLKTKLKPKLYPKPKTALRTNRRPQGVGIYFGPDIVQLSIYKGPGINPSTINRLPTITFTDHQIEFFCPVDDTRPSHYNVYDLLHAKLNYKRAVRIDGKTVNLLTEEIVAIFFNKLKAEAEHLLQNEIKSCVVAASSCMSTGAKQILKSSLSIAGFEKSTLLQSTTAIGLLYATQYTPKSKQPIILVHNSTKTFEIAVATITPGNITINHIAMDDPTKYKNHPNASRRFCNENDPFIHRTKLLAETVAKLKKEVVLVIASSANCEKLTDAIKARLEKQGNHLFLEEDKIALGAAVLDHSLIQTGEELSVKYVEVYPYTFTASVNNTAHQIIVGRNTPIMAQHLKQSYTSPKKNLSPNLTIREVQNQFVCSFSPVGPTAKTNDGKYLVSVTLSSEGIIEAVELKSQAGVVIPLKANPRFLNLEEQQAEALTRKLSPIFKRATSEVIRSGGC